MLVDVQLMLDELVAQPLLLVTRNTVKAGDTVDHIARQMEPVQVVQYGHVEGSGCSSFLLVSAHVQIIVVCTSISQAVNEPRIAVKGKNDGFVGGEDGIEIPIGQAVRMFAGGLQRRE